MEECFLFQDNNYGVAYIVRAHFSSIRFYYDLYTILDVKFWTWCFLLNGLPSEYVLQNFRLNRLSSEFCQCCFGFSTHIKQWGRHHCHSGINSGAITNVKSIHCNSHSANCTTCAFMITMMWNVWARERCHRAQVICGHGVTDNICCFFASEGYCLSLGICCFSKKRFHCTKAASAAAKALICLLQAADDCIQVPLRNY